METAPHSQSGFLRASRGGFFGLCVLFGLLVQLQSYLMNLDRFVGLAGELGILRSVSILLVLTPVVNTGLLLLGRLPRVVVWLQLALCLDLALQLILVFLFQQADLLALRPMNAMVLFCINAFLGYFSLRAARQSV